MNYFELFELPLTLKTNKKYIQEKYFELQKKYHPDFFSNESEQEQDEALEKSSLVNKGYKTFQNDDDTIRYVLQLKGLLEEEEKYALPPDFLMEMMELNEALAEGDSATIEEATVKIDQFQKQLLDKVQYIIEYYNEDNTTNEQLLQVKDYYFKKKYLNRILERLDGMRNIAARN